MATTLVSTSVSRQQHISPAKRQRGDPDTGCSHPSRSKGPSNAMANGTPPTRAPRTKAASCTRHSRPRETEGSQAHMPHVHSVKDSQRHTSSSQQQGGAHNHSMGRRSQRPEREDSYPVHTRVQIFRRIRMHIHRHKARGVPSSQESLHPRLQTIGHRTWDPSQDPSYGPGYRIPETKK